MYYNNLANLLLYVKNASKTVLKKTLAVLDLDLQRNLKNFIDVLQ